MPLPRVRRGHNALGGNVVWVLGPGGQRHYYAHLDRFAHVPVGQRIEPGTVLGYVGNTGNARMTPPHLHYGIYGSAGAINPFPLLAQAGKVKREARPRIAHAHLAAPLLGALIFAPRKALVRIANQPPCSFSKQARIHIHACL